MKSPALPPVVLFLTLLAAPWPLAAGPPDARTIFQTLEPSVALLSDAEGSGSGVVISAEGLVLTNYHVANTPLPLTVEVFVEENGTLAKKSLPNAVLVKVHASNDLALVKVDPGGGRLKPAKLSKAAGDALAGGTCYVMGFPALGIEGKPALTITKGIISATNRMVGGLPYLQMDAAINPGNSGGALLNEQGVVIGIPTLKFENTDRIGMAAPLANLKLDQFVKPADRPGNPQEAARLSRIADLLVAQDAFSLGQDEEAVRLAVYVQRQALALEPANAQWPLNLARMYHRLKRLPLAKAYGEVAVRKDPANLFSRALLADIFDQLKEPDQAREHWLACLSLPAKESDGRYQAVAFEKLAAFYAAKRDPARAYYVISWAAAAGIKETTARRLVLQSLAGTLDQRLVDEVMAIRQGHGIEGMESFARRAPAAAATPAPPGPVTTETTAPPPGNRTYLAVVAIPAGGTLRLLDAPPEVVFRPETHTLEWTPPPFTKILETSALLLLTKADGTEAVLVQTIRRP